ncbi:E3 ubiquitin-protein ligase TRIM22 isoform X1 [Papio anubis]|uniref:Tripartite motif-containing protein 5 n=1 Tax=Papio anubis TaxID=9555 RepID=A9L8Z5_PAPAN|nr:E3 ubiquitin-protein ligase TRIM22 [Papio anubis]XP_031508595.1 E3 ubiquitin-protein ligase TRIM22 isoform X1 [Papio anubis]ABX52156.1 tripartite motif-containing 22 (predicted) [Papio anubis]
MDFSVKVDIEKEVTCPICLELLTEPLSLDCGHSFCQACITAKIKESVTISRGESSCPVCQSRFQPGKLRPNRHLANIVERVKEVKMSPQEGQKRDICEHHGKKLQIFCKEDGKVICWVCELSQEHQGHQTFRINEVVKECQEKLQAALQKLTKEDQEAEKLEDDIRQERTIWKNYIQIERQKILKGFNEMRVILDSEEQRELQKLEEGEVNVLDNLAAASDQLVQQRQDASKLISDLQRRLRGSSIEMLQDVIDVMKRSENWTLKKPKPVSKKLKSVFRAPDLSRMLQVHKELTDVQCHWVDVMLNPNSTISNVAVSVDQRQVATVRTFAFKNSNPRDFSDFGVLGCQHFSSGKYYWEVDVSGKIAWILGVYSKISSPNKRKSSGFVFDPSVNYANVYSKYRPQYGYWVIGLQNTCEYNAFEDSSSADPKVLTLFMAVPPCRVGVFLNYEAGIVSFFNVTNHGALIYKFSGCRFSQPAYPYFNPWNCQVPMTLCQPSS